MSAAQHGAGEASTPTARADILRRFYRDGQNTCEIGRALDLPETVVAKIVRQERERRTGIDARRSG